ncbi:MAG: hypothetical protein SW833_12210 [Cyanobacteriota bacterium]|nr:hypothetical protein [Cyanobacteriota bacterium]
MYSSQARFIENWEVNRSDLCDRLKTLSHETRSHSRRLRSNFLNS